MKFRDRSVCSLACATSLRDAERKAACDAQDLNPVVCRCAGAPVSLEPAGVHCRECRRMFSAQVRYWLATEDLTVGRLARVRLGYEAVMRRIFLRVPHAV